MNIDILNTLFSITTVPIGITEKYQILKIVDMKTDMKSRIFPLSMESNWQYPHLANYDDHIHTQTLLVLLI